MFQLNSDDDKNKKNKKKSVELQLPEPEPGDSQLGNREDLYKIICVQDNIPPIRKHYTELYNNGKSFKELDLENIDIDIADSSKKKRRKKWDVPAITDSVNNTFKIAPSVIGESPFKYYDRTEPWQKHLKRMNPNYTDVGIYNMYASSQQAIDDVVNNYYNNYLHQVYVDCQREQERQIKEVMNANARNPIAAMRMAQYKNDPMKVIDNTMNRIDMEKLREMVMPLTDRIDMEPDEYINNFIKPTLRDMMIRKYVDANKPKNSFEYILRSINEKSLIGKVANIGMGNRSSMQLERESLAAYKPNRAENFAANVGGLLVDIPAFRGIGAASNFVVGKATSMTTNRLATRIHSYNAAEGMTFGYAKRQAERLIKENLTTKIMQGATINGFTLGTYDLANSVAEDILYNESIDMDKANRAFARSFLTGSAVGTINTAFGRKIAGLTGGKKVVASAGVLSAESAVFTASTHIDKTLHGADVEPIDIVNDYLESIATLGIMKFTHIKPKGAEYKLDRNGELKQKLKLTKSEQEELRELNMNPKEFMDMVENYLKYQPLGSSSNYYDVVEKYITLMQSKDVSATTKSKMMYLIENKITSTPPVIFDYNVEKTQNNDWILTTYDFEGNKIERHVFEHAGNAKNYLLAHMGDFRKNRIAAYERELLQVFDSQNFLRQAGLYVKETGVSVDEVAEALHKRAKKMELTQRESEIVQDIVERTTYNETGMTQFLYDMRREIERKHRLVEGAMLDNIDLPFYSCSKAENAALDEYEELVRTEANLLKQGADPARAEEFEELGRNSMFKGMSNDEVKRKEVLDFKTNHEENRNPNAKKLEEKLLEIKEEEEEPGIVWNYEGIENTVEDLENYKSYADKIAKKLNVEIEYIWNERDIPRPVNGDRYDITNYNNKLRAKGWAEEGKKVVVNLPNIECIEELEKTIVHEAVVHVGLPRLFGNHFYTFLEELYYKSTPGVRMGIHDMKRTYKVSNNFTLIEEYLASLVEKNVSNILDKSFYKDFKDFVKNSLVKMKLYTGRNRRVTEEELANLLRQHAKYMKRNTDPSKYRRWVFGTYDAAKLKPESYTDKEVYGDYVKEKFAEGKFFKKTPRYLFNHKAFKNYEFMPEHVKDVFRKRWDATDEYIHSLKTGDESFRLTDAKAGYGNEGFNNSDVAALNSRLEQKYYEAMRMVKALENARMVVPDFDKEGVIDRAFAADYQFTPDVFKKRFPSFDEYLIHKLSGGSVVPFKSYEDARPVEKAPIKQSGDLKKYFTGPLDIIHNMLQRIKGSEHD